MLRQDTNRALPLRIAATGSRRRGLRRRLLASDGGSLVEFALTMPVLLMLVTGIYTFGVAFNNYMELTDAVSVGARLLAISRQQTTDPCAAAATAIQNAAPYLSSAQLKYTFVLNGNSFGAYAGTGNASCSSASTSTGAAADLVQQGTAEVLVTYPCSLTVYGVNYAPGCLLTAETTEMVQ
jgi:Flp pilus assembly protein TadG